MFDLHFSDLTTAAQARFLAACGLKNAAEGNYDVLPIVSLPCENDEEEGE